MSKPQTKTKVKVYYTNPSTTLKISKMFNFVSSNRFCFTLTICSQINKAHRVATLLVLWFQGEGGEYGWPSYSSCLFNSRKVLNELKQLVQLLFVNQLRAGSLLRKEQTYKYVKGTYSVTYIQLQYRIIQEIKYTNNMK